MNELFSQFDVDHMLAECRRRVLPYDLKFGALTWLSNSHSSLEAAEYARENGHYDAFHHAVFKAYFSEKHDIGDRRVLQGIAKQIGLDPQELEKALNTGIHSNRVAQGTMEARKRGITAVPTFFIEDLPPIIGAAPENRFRSALQSIEERK